MVVFGWTICSELQRRPQDIIFPFREYTYTEDDGSYRNMTEITFQQKIEKKYNLFNQLKSMVLKLTVQRKCTIDDKPYNCEVIGDGTVHHFGIVFP